MKTTTKLYRPGALVQQQPNLSRRRFVQGTSALLAAAPLALPAFSAAKGNAPASGSTRHRLANNPLGFNGERQDPVTGLYSLGNGYRVYNPRLMRFHACDSMSPFGKGGVNSYAYCVGDPINLRDPSGHFAILAVLIGAAIGAVISLAVEGIKSAITGAPIDWKQVGIGAALGALSGGFGALAQGASLSTKFGLAVADAVVSGAADFGLNVAAGTSAKEAGINAGVGAVIGLGGFGVGRGVSGLRRARVATKLSQNSPMSGLQGEYFDSNVLKTSAPGSVRGYLADVSNNGSSTSGSISVAYKKIEPYAIDSVPRSSLSSFDLASSSGFKNPVERIRFGDGYSESYRKGPRVRGKIWGILGVPTEYTDSTIYYSSALRQTEVNKIRSYNHQEQQDRLIGWLNDVNYFDRIRN